MKMKILVSLFVLLMIVPACEQATAIPTPMADRPSAISANAVKHTPADDFWPPTGSQGWSHPEPMPGPVNTAGAEDSPFITLDGNDFYFFFPRMSASRPRNNSSMG
jgi:hypothetical protein